MAKETNAHLRGIWEQFTMRDGLPDMKIESIYEDSQGVLWIGTHDGGVARYEGDGFQVYNRRDGLAGNGVFSIIEDRAGDLWFGTSMGLSRFDGKKFQTIETEEPHSFLWGRCMDREGRLWFGLERKPGRPPAVGRWDGERLEIMYLEGMMENEEQGRSINTVVIDSEGCIWFGGHGFFRYDGDIFHLVEGYSDSTGQVISLHVDQEKTLWGTTDRILFKLNKLTGNPMVVYESTINHFLLLFQDSTGLLWLHNHDGGMVFCYDGKVINPLIQIDTVFWRGFWLDHIGRLWIGTYGMGLYCYDATRLCTLQIDQGLTNRRVNCLAGDSDGALWIGTQSGIMGYDGKNSISQKISQIDLEVFSLILDRENRLWIGTRSGHVWVYDRAELKLIVDDQSIERVRVNCLKEDLEGKIWFSSRHGKGFGYYEDGECAYLRPEQNAEYPVWIGAMEVDQEGYLWLGSASPLHWDGLCRYDGNSFERVPGISGCSILALCSGRDGRLWVGTNEGLICYHGKKHVRFTQEEGLSCNLITAIYETKDRTLWIGTDGGGVCCYDGKVFQVIQIPDKPGYNVIHAIHEDNNGQLWFATEGGLIQYTRHDVCPRVKITEIIVDENHMKPLAVKFPNTAGRVRFCFKGTSTLDYASRLVYRYRLHGHDREWRQTRKSTVEYSQLKPGEYTFAIQAIDRDLNYSKIARVKLFVTEDPWIEALNEKSITGKIDGTALSTHGGNLLLVDDDPIFSEHCHRLLQRAQYHVETCANAATALQRLGQCRYDLLLLNISMTNTEGLELLRMIKNKPKGPEVIILTEYKDLKQAIEATRLGANAYLTKPFEARQLLSQVEQGVALRKDPLMVYIRTHAGEIQSREELAELFRISANTVSNRVRKATQFSFSKYLQLCRIQEAQKLLAQTDLGIQEIASRMGFDTHGGFTRTFGKVTGRTPLHYRSEIRSSFLIPAHQGN